MNNNINEINSLNFEKIIAFIFIIVSALNIYGDSLQQKFLLFNNKKDETNAKNIFIVAVIISIILYAYFVNRNYKNYLSELNKGNDAKLEQIRLYGSILFIVGAFMLLYYLLEKKTPIGQPAV